MSVCNTMATCLLRTLLPVVSRIKFRRQTTQNLQRLTCLHPEARCLVADYSSIGDKCKSGPISYKELEELKSECETVVIDVRDRYEVEQTGPVPGCINIPFQEIEFALNYLKTDAFRRIYGADKPQKSSFLVFLCRSGSKAKKAMLKLKDSGFENVSFYKGSVEDLKTKSSKISFYLPSILRGMAGAPPGSGPKCKDLCYDDIIQLSKNKEIILIDVREPSEIKETGKLPGSIHIPLGEIKQALELTPPDEFKRKYGIAKPDMNANLVFSCRSGKRSRSAMETAMSLGFLNSRHYNGGYLDWQKHHPGAVV